MELARALRLHLPAFRAGAITGMLVAGLALLAIAVFYWYLTGPAGHTVGGEDRTVVEGLTALAFGASLECRISALWARSMRTH